MVCQIAHIDTGRVRGYTPARLRIGFVATAGAWALRLLARMGISHDHRADHDRRSEGPMQAHLARCLDEKPRPAVIVLVGASTGSTTRSSGSPIRSRRPIRRFGDRLSPRRRSSCASSTRKDVCTTCSGPRLAQTVNRTCSTEDRHLGLKGLAAPRRFSPRRWPGSPRRSRSTGRASRARSPAPTPKPALDEIDQVRVPLLLVFGGHDEQIGPTEIATIRDRLTSLHAPFEIESIPKSVTRSSAKISVRSRPRQIADAVGRVQSFLRRSFT